MEYVRLGSSGLKVSRLCLGCMSFGSGFDWMLPEEQSFAIVRKALDLGISFFDTANVYSAGESEQILGLIAHELGALTNDVVIEGHTDSRQYADGDRYGNWELSAERANAARRVMQRTGLRDGQVRAVARVEHVVEAKPS